MEHQDLRLVLGTVHSRTGDAQRRKALSAYRRRVLRTPKVVLASASVALALSACSGETDVAPAPASPSAASTPSPASSTATPVATPTSVATVEAEEPTFAPTGTFNENDAMAFGQFFVQVANHVRVTGDPALLTRYSAPDCDSCTYLTEVTDGLRANGARLLKPELKFEAAYLDSYDPIAMEAEVRVEVTGDLGQVVTSDGSVLHSPQPVDHAPAAVQMRFADGHWLFEEVL